MRQREFSYVPDDHIATAKDKAQAYAGRLATSRDFHRTILARAGGRLGEIDEDVRGLNAEINHGRWIAKCDLCGGAEVVDPEDPFFLCLTCLNALLGGRVRRAWFPAGHKLFELVLLEREGAEDRNWEPGDSLDKLKRQNKDKKDKEKK